MSDSIFPQKVFYDGGGPSGPYIPRERTTPGLTKRELFAAMALHGLLAADRLPREAVKLAVRTADALIEELDKK